MGGGGSGPGRIGDIDKLVFRARQELAEGSGRRNVFISFAYEDVATVNLLRGQAKNENIPLEFNDWSVSEPIDSQRAGYIKQKISDRISQSSVTVVFLSERTPASRWVDWEVKESLRLGKHVIAVHPNDARPSAIPSSIEEKRIPIVRWSDLAPTIEKLKLR